MNVKDKEKVQKIYECLLQTNDELKSGSFYLKSKHFELKKDWTKNSLIKVKKKNVDGKNS